eukprot:gb/GECH01012750.1/.p1 GENE.gb/GECH01012750.1/~~gb/GECH01012750.1/.p1  ORF type:complete len:187 (+),score=33.69 gb/GECH01012750.1/:1-561(+)
MGNLIQRIHSIFNDWTATDARILMVGLDAAGKTTMLYNMHLGEVVTTIPTIGFNVETVHYKNIKFNMWDVGGQHRIRQLWRHYFRGTQAVIWVVDAADRERLAESRDELMNVLNDDTMDANILLVYANKQDLPHALSPDEIAHQLRLKQNMPRMKWWIQPSCATSGDGIVEGLEWLRSTVKDSANN